MRRRVLKLAAAAGVILAPAVLLSPIIRYVRSTPPYQRSLSAAEAGHPLSLAEVDALPAPDGADPALYRRRVAAMVTFFDAYNCSNYALLRETLAEPDAFHYSVTTFPDDYIGFHNTVEYLVIGNPQATLGRTTLHILPQRPPEPLMRTDQHGETITLPLRAVLDMRGAERMQGDGLLSVTFAPGSDKMSRMFVDIPEEAGEMVGEAVQKGNAAEFICRSLHQTSFNTQMFAASLFFAPENDACPDYARGAAPIRPDPLGRLCEAHPDPRDGQPLLGGDFEACMAILGEIPVVDGPYTRSAGADTIACRTLHGIGARVNPAHHCMHLQVPSLGVDGDGQIGTGPCAEGPGGHH